MKRSTAMFSILAGLMLSIFSATTYAAAPCPVGDSYRAPMVDHNDTSAWFNKLADNG